MASAKIKMLDVLKCKVGKLVPSWELREASGNISDWARQLRTLRQEGWDLEHDPKRKGYILNTIEKKPGFTRANIDAKTRVLVLKSYGYKCAYCGRSPEAHGIILHIDHKIPVDLGGGSEFENLQPLCSECNLGKKNLFKDEDPDMVKNILTAKSNREKLRIFFDHHLGKKVPVKSIIPFVTGREWMRALRYLREDGYKIKYVRAEDCYIVTK